MEPRDLNRMFDGLAPTPQQEQAVLDRLLQTEREVKPMKKLKKLTVVGIAAALTVISCAAGVVSGGDRRLIDCFGGGEQVEELIPPVAVDQFHTYENGWTVAISQVLADRLSLAVLVDVTVPEGTALSREERLDLRLDQLDSQGERISSGHPLMGFLRQLEDGDPADNHMTVLWQVRKTEGAGALPYLGSALRLTPVGVRFQEGERMVSTQFNRGEADGWWSCTVRLPEEDPGVTYPIGGPVTINGTQVILSAVYLTPLSATVYVEDREEALRRAGWIEWEQNVSLELSDGTQLAAAGTQGKVTGVSYTLLFDLVIDPVEVESITLFGQTFPLN